jgi:MFS family permease
MNPVPNPPLSPSPADRKRALLALVAGQICLHSAMAGLRMALPLMLLRQGAGLLPAEVGAGLLLGCFAAAPVLTALPAGRWADRRGYHKPVHAAIVLVLLAGLCAAAGVAGSGLVRAGLLVLAALLAGTGANLGLITIQRTAGQLAAQGAEPGAPIDRESRGAELKKMFGWLGLAPSLSNVIGPLLAGVLIDLGGFALTGLLLAALPLGTWLCARWVPRQAPAPRPAVRPPSALHSVRELLAVPGMKRLLAINWFFSTSWDLHSFLVPLLGHELGLAASVIGAVLGVFSLAVTGVRLLVPLLAERLREQQVLTGAMLLVAAAYAVYPLAHSVPAMMACAVLLGLALGAVQPMIMTTLHHLAPAERQGEAIALRSALINLSSATLPLGYGLLGGALGAAGLFRLMALLLLGGLALPARMKT